MSGERLRDILFYGLLALMLGLCIALMAPFLGLIAWAGILAVVIFPLHRRVSRQVRNPSLAAALSCLAAITMIVVPATLVMIEVRGEIISLTRQIQPAQFASVRQFRKIPVVRSAYLWLESRLGLSPFRLETGIQQAAGQIGSSLAKQSVNAVKSVIWGAVQAVILLMILFFLLRDAPQILSVARAFLPFDGPQMETLLNRLADTIYAIVFGQIVVAIVQGTLGGLAFWALGLPSPLLWGLVMILLCMVPLLGAPMVWAPAALLLALNGSYGSAVALTLWGMLVVGTIDNVLRPFLMGARMQLHPLLVFFTVCGGLMLLGPTGLFLGPLILIMTLTLLEMLKLKTSENDTAFLPQSAAARGGDLLSSP